MRIPRLIGGIGCLLFVPPVLAAWSDARPVPAEIRWLSLAILVVALARPLWGLLAIGFLTPVTVYIHALTRAEPAITSAGAAEILIAPFLLAAGLRLAAGLEAPPARLARPALFFGAVIACSGVMGLAASQLVTMWPREFIHEFVAHLPKTYFDEAPVFAPYHMAIFWIEGLTLAVFSERLLRANPRAWPAIAIAGTTAASATVWVRLAQLAMKYDIATVVRVVRETRVNTLFKDPNAAASMFALYLVPAIWLAYRAARSEDGSKRWLAVAGYGLASWLIGFSLWLTVSRAAYAGVVVGLSALWLARRRLSRKTIAFSVSTAAVALLVFVVLNPGSGTQKSSATSMEIRVEMARIAWAITEEHPMFGVGLGDFRRASRAFISDDLLTLFPHTRVGENAHNNFLQILAELGGVGLIGFLWLLWAAWRAIPSFDTRSPPAIASRAVAGGLLALLVSCLAGHPFLTGEVFWTFCLMLGAAAGIGGLPAAAPAAPVWPRRLAIAAVALVVISLPVRFWQLRYVDLRQNYFGAGRLMKDGEGQKYHLADARSLWWIPSDWRLVEIPLRTTEDSAAPCLVQVQIDRKPVNVIRVDSALWTRTTIQLMPTSKGPRSRSVELLLDRPECHLKVGEITTRD